MENKPINPQAFLVENDPYSGMTLRDYFANSAMQGIISCYIRSVRFQTLINESQKLAEVSYNIADEMLKQREKKQLKN